jgi:hypothetical protein
VEAACVISRITDHPRLFHQHRMTEPRRFPLPWTVEEGERWFVVSDH